MTFVDVFCGAGGWTQGLLSAGLTHVLGIDIDAAAIATYTTNHGSNSAIVADIITLTREEFIACLAGRRVDVVVGSPPCVSFSAAGPRRSGDVRDSLYKQLINVGAWCDASMIVMENVCGFRTKDGGSHFNDLVMTLEEAGYIVCSKVLNALHFGAPQNRKRVIVIAHKPNLLFQYPAESPCTLVMKDIIEPRERITDPFYWMTSEKAKYYVERQISKPQYVKIIALERPARTMRAGYMKSWGAEALILYEDGECRMLTEQECAAIQTFPATYIWRGSRSAIYCQIGNAVPPSLSKSIGSRIMESFSDTCSSL